MDSTLRSTVRVAACRSGMDRAMTAFNDFLAAHSLDPAAVWPMKVALDEVLSNVVTHAYASCARGVIDLAFALQGDELEISVVDDGKAQDPLATPEPDTTSALEAREPGGLGVYLVRRLSDRVSYTRRDGRNHLVFGKRVTR